MELQIINQQEVLGKNFTIYGTLEDPLFLAKDVADWIEHSKSSVMIDTVDDDEKLRETIFTSGQNREMWFLTENGLYEVLMQSRKPIAKQFKKQVKQILKSIRKHGMYAVDDLLDNPDMAIAAFQKLKEEREERKRLEVVNTQLQLELQEAQKQARYLDLIIESKGALRVTQIAADYGMSANKFNKTLLEFGVQHKVNGQWILYKKHMGKGYTDSHTFDYQDKNGHTRANVTTTWTQKGRLFLYELLKDNGILPLIEQDDVA
ncbi:TPA: phage antirepressor KilAC domain-containing protein [Streptococcus suis]|uniref:Prophage LambdaSa1, antirepressor n=1 Tax=Streptococcus suis TaxID=1307 RepID=A0A822VLV8_STRSU|nr:phage antirepressor KilAC domain-containing protein [Streptococcus suis]QBX21170.1 antirepressor protein [Streptococcus phage Javan563]QBX21290.1 antirepressor protein [Streptococcus phage Javan567]QBX21346.1 antirepressor protein [Streptococcus phage Javan569]QBX31039.1 antirepressor protein [Streptococcus phage Javan590]AGZ23327.1 kilA protein, phage-related DNA binding protein [Streptococcus suis T15]